MMRRTAMPTDDRRAAMRAEVRGDVQGGAFRDAVLRAARDRGLLGWVREDEDGAVRVHAEGAAGAVAELRAFLGEEQRAVEEQRAKVEGHEQFAVRGVPAGAFAVER